MASLHFSFFLQKDFSLQLYFYQLILFVLSLIWKLSSCRKYDSSYNLVLILKIFTYTLYICITFSSLWKYSPFLRWRRRPILSSIFIYLSTWSYVRDALSSELSDQCTYVYDIDDTISRTLITGCPASSRNRFGGGFCTWKQ